MPSASLLTDEIMTSGDSSKAIAIARSWEGINGLFTACGIMCKLWLMNVKLHHNYV